MDVQLALQEREGQLACERNAHRVTEQLYRRALEEVDALNKELMRVHQTWNEEIRSEAHELRSCRMEVEALRRERAVWDTKVRELEGRTREIESELVDTHRRLTEAVVASSHAASRIEEAEQTALRLKRLNEQLESDNARIRSAKHTEVENYRADLEAALEENARIAARLKQSEVARLQQSAFLESFTQAEAQLEADKRRLEADLAAARAAIAELEMQHAGSAQLQRDCGGVDDVRRTLTGAEGRNAGGDAGAEDGGGIDGSSTAACALPPPAGVSEEGPSVADTAYRDMQRLQAHAAECRDLAEYVSTRNAALTQRLAEVTRCLLDIARSDAELRQVVDLQSQHCQRSAADIQCLTAENERLSAMVCKAAAQMEHFNEAVEQAEASQAKRADATLRTLRPMRTPPRPERSPAPSSPLYTSVDPG